MYLQVTLRDIASEWVSSLGYKAAAQQLFRLLHLFPSPLLVFPAGTQLETVEKELLHEEFVGKGLAVRFSRAAHYPLQQQINAPRLFSDSTRDILEFVTHWAADHDSESSVIVQPSIDLAYSYELHLDRHGALVEIFPGLWELDNSEPVDSIRVSGRSAELSSATRQGGKSSAMMLPLESTTIQLVHFPSSSS